MPAPKPPFLPEFASGLDAAIVEPLAGQKASGWLPGTAPPAETMNWLHNGYYRWAAYLDTFTENALTWMLRQTFSLGITVASGGADITGNITVTDGTVAVSGGVTTGGDVVVGGGIEVTADVSATNVTASGNVQAASVNATTVTATTLTGRLTVEAPRIIGAAGQPAFENGYTGVSGTLNGVSHFYKDPANRVWVQLVLASMSGQHGETIVTLPEGYWPSNVEWLLTNILVRTGGVEIVPQHSIIARVNTAGQIWLVGSYGVDEPTPPSGTTVVVGSFRAA